MSLSTTKHSLETFFPYEVLAFISDSSMDFKLQEEQTKLTDNQKAYLNRALNMDLPDVINIQQVHDKDIVVIKDAYPKNYVMQKADGIITNAKNTPIAIRTADCVPIFLFDPVKKCIGVIHAGWQSTKKQIAKEAVLLLQKHFQTKPQDLKVFLGPAIQCDACEVGEEFRQYFPDEVLEINGKLHLNVALANRNQFKASGVLDNNIQDCGECTFSKKEYFSYRRQKDGAGRMLHLMMLKSFY